jgi:ATP-dependent Clp protease protease subunit
MTEESPDQITSVPYELITLQNLGAHMLFGEINQVSALQTCEFIIKANMLRASSSPLTLLVNSEGGSVNDGFAIIDIMETSRLPIQTVGTGLIASMGLLISTAGHKGTRTITKNTEIMAHQFIGGVYGKHHELMAVQHEHLRLEQLFIKHFVRHSNMTEKQIKDILFSPSDRWLSPDEAKKYGLCDRVTEFLDIPDEKPKAKRPSRAKPKAAESEAD